MKYFKYILIGIFSLLFLLISTAFAIAALYKKEIAMMLIDELKSQYGLHLKIEDANVSFLDNWPRASISFKNTSLSSERFLKKENAFLKAGTISISINISKLLTNEVVIKDIALKNVELNLIKYADGSKNFEIKKSTTQTEKETLLDFNLDKIHFKNVHFQFTNQLLGQHIDFILSENNIKIKNYSDGLTAKIQGNVLIKQLLFKPEGGSFLTNTRTAINLSGMYEFKTKSIAILPPSFVEIEGQKFQSNAILELGESKKLSLVIHGKGVKSERVATYLNPKIKKVLSNFEVKRLLDASFILVTPLGERKEPIILAEVIGKDCDLSIGESKIPYSNLNFKGKIISMHSSRKFGDMEHARIQFSDFTGKIYEFPFKANLSVFNLKHPILNLEASLVIDGKKINQEIAKKFQFSGTALATVNYKGNAKKLNKKHFLDDDMQLNAYLLFNDLTYTTKGSEFDYTLNGKANLTNNFLSFENLKFKTNSGTLNLKGKVFDFLNYVLGFSNHLKANVDAESSEINLNPIINSNKTNQKNTNHNKRPSTKLKGSLFDFNVNVKASKLLIRNIISEQVRLKMNYKNDLILINDFQVKTCDGDISANGKIENLNKINAEVAIKNVDATKLFEQFENFGQEAVKSENLKGKITIEANISVSLDENNEFKGESMNAEAKIKITDGHLINYEPIQNISNFIFKQRDFHDVSFSELKERIKVRGFEMKIDELEIASNVLNLYIVNGLYSMKGNSNFNMLIPWSNLKKRGKNYIPKESGESAGNTKGLKLNYSGMPKKMKLSFGHKEQEKRFWF